MLPPRVAAIFKVVTDMAILGFAETSREMVLEALHPGVSIDQVRNNTGCDIQAADLETTKPPSARELAVLRELDPDRLYIA